MTTPESVLRKIREVKEKKLTRLIISGLDDHGIKEFPVEILELTQLTELRLSYTQLTSLPDSISNLQNLTWLSLINNQLTSLPESISNLQNLTSLEVATNKLTNLPESIGQLQNLISLNLAANPFIILPEVVTQLQKLIELDLSYDQLKNLPEPITKLQKLKTLKLNGNQFLNLPDFIVEMQNLEKLTLCAYRITNLPELITKLQNLTSLDLSGNQLANLPESIEKLQKLTTLNLSVNKFSNVPETLTKLQYLTTLVLTGNRLASLPESITNLRHLTELDLGANQFTNLPESITKLQGLTTLNLGANYSLNIPDFIAKLQQLTKLALTACKITNLPEIITQLQNLISLSLSKNQLTSLPETISRLRNLTELHLMQNQITSLPESVAKLQNLRKLDLSFNQLTYLPESITKLQNLTILNLSGNKLETPPQEVAEKGIKAIREYFRQLEEQGQEKLYEAKLIILGEGGAGKTTFANKIKNPDYQLKEEESTRGVDVIKCSFPVEGNKEFKVNIWDFGGQEVYHATHQFFLTRRSLYALVADTRREDTDFYYWLSVAELLSDGSPLLIVNNEKQDHKKELNERQLKGQFNNIKDVLDVNLSTNSGLDRVRAEVEHYLKSLPHIGSPLPKTWVRVREALEGDKRNYISQEEYLSLCKQNGFADTKDSLQLSGYLNDIGVFLHFQDEPLLRKTVILKPKWGTDAVYSVLDHPTVVANKGRFSRADVESIWNESEYENIRDELLQLMMKFKLCYEIPNQKGNYIAPQLLSEKQLDYKWDGNENLFLQYNYEFMPKGILLQFIVAMSDSIWDQTVWKSGVVLEEGGARAEVIEYYGKRQIHVRVAGANKKALMTIVIHELDKINKAYKQLKYDKMIPCNCGKCKASETPHFYALERLLKRLANKRDGVECEISYQEVSIRGLIDDIMERIPEQDERDSRIVHYHFEGDYVEGDKKMTDNKISITGSTIHGSVVAAESIKNSFNTIEKADIKDDLKEQLKLLTQAVEAMAKELPKEKAEEVADAMKILAEQAVKEKPNPTWYNVSIKGLIKAADNLGEVGDRVINLSKKVFSILTGGILEEGESGSE